MCLSSCCNGIFCFYYWLLRILIYSRCWSFVSYMDHKYFLVVLSLSFHPGQWVSHGANCFKILTRSNIVNFPFVDFAFVIKLKNSLPRLVSKDFISFFFLKSLVLHTSLWSILSEALKFRLRFSFFAYGFPIASFVKMSILPPLNCFCSAVKNKLEIFEWIYFWVLYSVSLIYVSISFQTSHCLDYGSCVRGFNIRRTIPPTLFFFFKIVLAIL